MDSTKSYASAVKWASDSGIINGNGSDEFKPESECTRAMFINMLWKYAGMPTAESTNIFTDVVKNSWYEQAVNWGVEQGIINGKTGSTFSPDDACKRADAINMIYKYFFKDNDYNITYNLNGGSVRNGSSTNYTAGKDTFTINNPQKEGYTFLGWTGSNYTREGFVGEGNYIPSTKATITLNTRGNCAFSANWEPNTYTISFNSNGGTGVMDKEALSYDSARPLLKNQFTKEGYVFKNWSTNSNGTGTKFNDEEVIRNLTITNGKSITLYAQWTPVESEYIEYTVEHYREGLNGEYNRSETEKFTTTKGSTVTPNVKQYVGFTLPNKESKVINENGMKIVYQYKRNQYNIDIEKGQGIEEASGNSTYKYEQQVKLYASAKQGYGDIRWQGYNNTNEFDMPAQNLKITVSASLIEYNITYDLDGGSATGNKSKYNIDTDSFKLNDPVKTGYKFIGWTGSNGTVPQKDVTIGKGTMGNLSFKANWNRNSSDNNGNNSGNNGNSGGNNNNGNETVKKYFVNITKGKNIESITGNSSYTKGEKVVLSATPKKGYGNIKWSGDKNVNEFYMPDKDLNIEVNATPITYKIEYDLNGGSEKTNPKNYTVESNIIKLQAPKRIGYKFIGWTGSNGNEAQIDVTVPIEECKDLRYVANWEVVNDTSNSQELNVQIEYSEYKLTNKNITVIISSNNKITNISEGWTILNDGKSASKEYEENITEDVIVQDEYQNSITRKIEIANIDKTKPQINVDYIKNNEQQILVILTSNKELQELDGWELSDDKKVLKKIYEVNTQESIIVKDIAGNEQTVLISINQINNNNDNNRGEDNNTNQDGNNKKNDIIKGNIIDSYTNKINSDDNDSDNTINKEILPQTGEKIFIIITITAVIISMVITFIKYRSLKDVK